jgi:hypothetical protein
VLGALHNLWVPHDNTKSTYLSLRIPRTLDADLKRAAEHESNCSSAVARRLITEGLRRERLAAERDSDEPSR